MDDFFDRGLTKAEVVAKSKRHRNTINDWISKERAKGRERSIPERMGPKPLSMLKPLSPLHKKIGQALYAWRQGRSDPTPSAAAKALGYSLFSYSKIEMGMYDITLEQAIEIVQVTGAKEVLCL